MLYTTLTRSLGRLAAPLALLAGLAGAPVAAEEVVVRAANFWPNDQVGPGAHFMTWVEETNAAAEGILRIEVVPFGSIPQNTMGDAVQTGVIDMANMPPAFYGRLVPWAQAIKLATIPHSELNNGPANEWINARHNEVGLQYLMTYAEGANFIIYTSERPVHHIEDLAGLTLRGNAAFRAPMDALGVEMVATAPSEILTSIERGLVGGLVWNNISNIADLGLDRYIHYRLEPGWYVANGTFIANLDWWNDLPEEARALLQQRATEYGDTYAERFARPLAEQVLANDIANGIEVTELQGEERQRFLDMINEAGWAELTALDPEVASTLRTLITR